MEKIGMKEMSQKFCALHHSGPWSREVRVCVHRVYTVSADRGKLGPTRIFEKLWSVLNHFIQVETAGRDDQNFRRPLQHNFPGNTNRIRSFASKRIDSARYLDHLRHPVTTAID